VTEGVKETIEWAESQPNWKRKLSLFLADDEEVRFLLMTMIK
jgi:hypothetical protein